MRRLRVHSRLPVVLPARITGALLDAIGHPRLQTVMVIHSNHANELDAEVAAGIAALRARAVTVLNQSVLMAGINDSAQALNEIAWIIVDAPGLEKRDLALCEKLATRAVELTDRKDGAILDTLARVHFEKGNIDKAIELQTEAVAKAQPEMKAEIEKTLAQYKEARAKKPL